MFLLKIQVFRDVTSCQLVKQSTDCLTLKLRTLRCFESPRTVCHSTRRNVSEDLIYTTAKPPQERETRQFFKIKPTDPLISQNYFCRETLHVSGSSSAHRRKFSTVHLALVYVMQVCLHIPVPNVQWKTPDDGQRNCSSIFVVLKSCQRTCMTYTSAECYTGKLLMMGRGTARNM